MAYEIILSTQAKRDLREIMEFWGAENPAIGEQIGAALVDRAATLDMLPYRGAPVLKRSGLRKLIHAPYHTIYYFIEERPQRVEIARFWDGRRNPVALKLPKRKPVNKDEPRAST